MPHEISVISSRASFMPQEPNKAEKLALACRMTIREIEEAWLWREAEAAGIAPYLHWEAQEAEFGWLDWR